MLRRTALRAAQHIRSAIQANSSNQPSLDEFGRGFSSALSLPSSSGDQRRSPGKWISPASSFCIDVSVRHFSTPEESTSPQAEQSISNPEGFPAFSGGKNLPAMSLHNYLSIRASIRATHLEILKCTSFIPLFIKIYSWP